VDGEHGGGGHGAAHGAAHNHAAQGILLGGKEQDIRVTSVATARKDGAKITVLNGKVHVADGDAKSFIIVNGKSGKGEKGGARPLLVLNGDVVDGLDDIEADAVKSVTVLKGNSATATYGAAAADGVVVISTKKGDDKK
jgi:TonB-dependent SusC/RagA subfamily outer membrane receptor